MATSLSLTWTPSGSKKANAAARTFTASAPAIVQSAGEFRTVTSIARKNGLYCTCGGTAQSVVIDVYDQLIDTSSGAVILTSGTARCTCRGSGPSSENIATTSFTGISAANSRRIVAAWKAGTLQIKRTATIVSYTSSSHGTPYFRCGYYDDIITIGGTDAAYSPAISVTAFDATNETLLYASSWGSRPFSFTVSTTVAASTYWASSTLYRRLTTTIENLSGGSAPGTVSTYTSSSTATSLSIASTSLTFTRSNGFARGNRYRVTFTLAVGSSASDLTETATAYVEIDVAAAPLHVSRYGHGIAVGMYSAIDEAKDKAGTDSRFDIGPKAVFHAGATGLSAAMLGVQAGSIAAGGNLASGSYRDVAVTFPYAYPSGTTPVVVVGFDSASTAGNFGRCCCAVLTGSVTNTGFTLRWFNGDSGNRDPGFAYVAVGTPVDLAVLGLG